MCGKTGKLNPHHVIGRRNLRLRWDLRNRCWLCYTHHVGGSISAHNDPVWFLGWFKQNRPGDYKYLQEVKNEIVKRSLEDYEELYGDICSQL